MPNLEHDPKNPCDLLGRPIAVGAIVAWGTTYGRSAAIAVCEIHKIRFIRKAPPGNWRKVNEECEQWQAEDYQLYLKPLKSTGGISDTEYVPGGYTDDNGKLSYSRKRPEGAKPVRIQLVKNIVKLDLTPEEAYALCA